MKLLDMSARSLGESEDEPETDAAKLKEKQEKHARWEARGADIKAELREQLLFSFMPEAQKAAYVYLHGVPGEEKVTETVKPLTGISPATAREIVALLQTRRLSRGPWVTSELWRQLGKDGVKKRLEATAKG